MAIAKKPEPVTLFLGIMYHDEKLRDEALVQFKEKYGSVSATCERLNFSEFSGYYDSEIGGTVWKEYYLFETKFEREELAAIKTFTNELELTFASDTTRPINLDPGYLCADKFVLASAKDFAHRLYIGDGIFAEVTLHFKQDKVKFFSWTYKDYLQEPVEKLLLEGRKRHLQ